MNRLAKYILVSKNKNILINLLCRPFYNALKKGATMHPEYIKKVLWGLLCCIITVFIFGTNYYLDPADTVQLYIALFFFFGVFVILAMLYGYRHREKIERTDDVAEFSARAAFSGAYWGLIGYGISRMVGDWDSISNWFATLSL